MRRRAWRSEEVVDAANPGLPESETDAPQGARFAQKTISHAMSELHNAAQLDVLGRAGRLLRKAEQ